MGRQFITPLQDASIYEQVPTRNTGADEILEVGKTRETGGAVRALIQFDLDKFTAPFSSSYFLNLRIAHAEKFQRNQTLEFFVVDAAIPATGSVEILTFVGSNNETVTIGGEFYEWQDDFTPPAFEGGINTGGPPGTGSDSVAIMAANLIAAINLETSSLGGAGGEAYAAATALNPFVTAAAGSGTIVILTAKIAGVGGNTIGLATSSTDPPVALISGDFLTGGQGVLGSGSWDEGTGFFEQDLRNPKDGASWQIRDSDGNNWTFPDGTASLGGSTGSLVVTQSFDWKPEDVRIDITGQVRAWLTGTENNGLLIKIPVADETSSVVNTNIRFFSRNTHTVYPPTLEAVWNTQTMSVAPNCGLSLAPEEVEIFVQNLRPELTSGSTHRIRFGVRGSNIVKSFTNAARFKSGFFLPSGSHIGVQDAATKAFIVPFDTGSLLSADNTGSYFDLKIENMYINRTYKILVRSTKPWGTEVVDTGHTFRVV